MKKISQRHPKLTINIQQPKPMAQSLYQESLKSSASIVQSQSKFQQFKLFATSPKIAQQTVGQTVGQTRMKLKDYLFLAKTSASRMALERRKLLKEKSVQMNESEITESKQLRKKKYSIKNSQMLQILKEQMESDIQKHIRELQIFKKNMINYIQKNPVPSNSDMVLMYNLRGLIKRELAGSIKQMNDLYHSAETSEKEIPLEVDIMVTDQQMRTDFEGTNKRFSEKYQMQLDKRQSGKNR